MSDYNGFTNRATWNTVLWLFNDFGMYQQIKGYSGQDVTSEQAKSIVTDLMGNKTPDNVSLKDVNWQEIAEALSDQ